MNKLLVIIDPGHYGSTYNRGAVNTYYESNQMWKLSKYECECFEKLGVDVILSRKKKQNPDVYKRGNMAITNGKYYSNVVFISNHSNACSSSKTKGIEIYRSIYLPESVPLADAIIESIRAKTKSTSRGVKTRKCVNSNCDYYGVIRGAVGSAQSSKDAMKSPCHYAYIIEHGFHTNLDECRYLNSNDNLRELAQSITSTIYNFFA